MTRRSTFLCGGSALAVLACACTTRSETRAESALAATGCREHVLAWGDGPDELGRIEAGPERHGRGPQAIAVTRAGEVLVLDAEHGRVLAIGRSGDVRTAVDEIARDAEDLAAGTGGAIAAYSPLQARVWVFGADGTDAGVVDIDRSIRNVVGVALDESHVVQLRTAYQETLSAGSPAAPVALATAFLGKREGAVVLADGRGVSVRTTVLAPEAIGGIASLIVTANPPGERARVVATHPIPGRVDGAMVVGGTGDLVCLRVETLDSGAPRVHVERRAVCLHADTGRVAVDLPLAPAGPYAPPHELAVGGTSPVLAVLEPADDRVVVRTCEVTK